MSASLPMDLSPVRLEGLRVVLKPLAVEDVPALAAVGLDADTWTWITHPVTTAEGMRDYVEKALASQKAGTVLPFTILDKATGRAVGSTRFAAIEREHRRIEIGWTWVAPEFRRTHVNTEAKFLLLKHAFEKLGVNRVELKTDALNVRSRAAITRIGAKEEGTLRSHMVTLSGRVRDTVYFSIIASEWPRAKADLWARIHR